ncbi:Acetyltransferase (GNAT) domain-containing protein [Alkalibacterium subtropicum]|uniref:Acetyltransferase (GNAT) domain-containing protein n=1 Tax=Alkalibacterium subtropicum TaxID=753702 RepID=A0A1I1HAW1_9LACT|nr:GNAT family N-acetyltransferase [Alkalibacterium subtropicum]SFC21137.1 Acetyltransferase (GNAT) domain-containing protein [Alkalibacterium subtropicum]
MTEIKGVPAQPKDLNLVKQLLFETAEWLNKKGSTQWAGLLKGEDVHNIEGAIERQEVFLVYRSEKVVGTFALWSKQTTWDKDFWGKDETRDYYYLHRLALSADEHGRKSGSTLLDKAKEIAISENKSGLRLDCVASNYYLNSFYSKNGFVYVGVVEQYDNGVDQQDYHLYFWENRKKFK